MEQGKLLTLSESAGFLEKLNVNRMVIALIAEHIPRLTITMLQRACRGANSLPDEVGLSSHFSWEILRAYYPWCRTSRGLEIHVLIGHV